MMMNTWDLMKLRYKRSGLHLTPIGWFVVVAAVCIVLYKFYSMSERRPAPGKILPVMQELDIGALEKKYKDEMEHNINESKKSGNVILPKLPLFDRNLDAKANMEHIAKPKVKKFPVKLLLKPNIDCIRSRSLVILVTSDINRYQARNAIRQTWGLQENYKQFDGKGKVWETFFVMGSSGDENDAYIKDENDRYGDIIQADFSESDYEGTRKFMVGVKLVVDKLSNCKPKYLLKVPDHEFVNMPSILAWLAAKFKTVPHNIYLGKMVRMEQPIRDKTHPLHVSREDYPPKIFPDLIRGPVYFFSWDVIVKMNRLFLVQTPIAMEDGYIGILMKRLGVKPRHNERFQQMNFIDIPCHHLYMILVHNVRPQQQLTLFDNIERDNKSGSCRQVKRFH